METEPKVEADEYFAIIPEWLLYSDISANAVRLYAVLRRFADKGTGRAHPSRKTLAAKCRISERTLDSAVKELVSVGAIKKSHRKTEQGDWTSNQWIVITANPAVGGAENVPTPGADFVPTGGAEKAAQTIVTDNQSQLNQLEDEHPAVEKMKNLETAVAKAKKPRARDLIFEAVAEVCSIDWKNLTPSARGPLIKAVKELKQVGAEPEEIFNRAIAYKAKYSVSLTPSALAKHWPSLGSANSAVDGLSSNQAVLLGAAMKGRNGTPRSS